MLCFSVRETSVILTMEVRGSVVADVKALAPIMQRAYTEFNISVGIDPSIDFETVEISEDCLRRIFQSPKSCGITAFDNASGQPIGAAFLHFIGESLQQIGPVFVDPAHNNKGVGKAMMNALIQRANATNAKSISLVQIAANTKSFSLYAKLGFRPVECVTYFQGSMNERLCTREFRKEEFTVRLMEESDAHLCSELHSRVVGHGRETDICEMLNTTPADAWVAVKDSIIQAYTTGFSFEGHSIAISEEAFAALFQGVCLQKCKHSMSIYIPGRIYPFLIGWALKGGLQIIRQCWVMVIGQYQTPLLGSIWLPNILG